ncbi:MAG: DUF1080 domain-containing protein [Candidatus Omnitrophica bacterium]|nr:DUF1080 domain-containing protein [Candidatus Omnitrophota bacterium]MCB9781612.1 DUF1080 domain-containing protein [Candidatus Omnitrophota bacterium]
MKNFQIGLLLLSGVFIASAQSAQTEKDILFDGSNLDSLVAEWKVEDPYNELRDSIWSIHDGVLHGKGGIYGWLRSKKRYGDFLLHAEYKLLDENSNTGISIRCDPYTPYSRMNPSRTGYEVQLIHGDENLNEHGPFSLYRYVAPSVYSPNPIGEWHTIEIRCEGPVIQVTHNGDKVLEFDQSKDPTLKDIPLYGYVGLQTHGGGEAEFRNVWIQSLSDKIPPAPENPFQGLTINFSELKNLGGDWKLKADPKQEGASDGWDNPRFDDTDWGSAKTGKEVTAPAWFRTQFEIGPVNPKADVYLYFASARGKAHVYLNGRELGLYDPTLEGENQRFGFRADRYLDEGTNTVAVSLEGDNDGKASLGEAILLIEKNP